MATVVDCVDHHPSPRFVGPYSLVLRDVRPLPFRPWRGELSFFEIPSCADFHRDAIEAELRRAIATTSAPAAGQKGLFA